MRRGCRGYFYSVRLAPSFGCMGVDCHIFPPGLLAVIVYIPENLKYICICSLRLCRKR